MRKWTLLLVLILAFSVVAAATFAYFHYKRVLLPKTQGVEYVVGLHGPVHVYRDQYGVPHIVAVKSDLDAFYALGFVHAQDRFWQMTFQRHVAAGTLSELFGEKTVKQDKFLRTWGFYRAAQATWQALDPQAKAIVKAYTAGVNAFIKQGNFPLPIRLLHFHPKLWTPVDSIVWQKMMAWDLQDTWQQKVKNYLLMKEFGEQSIHQYFPPYPQQAPVTLSTEDLIQSGIISDKEANTTLVHDVKPSDTSQGAIDQALIDTLKTANQIRQACHFESMPGKGSNAWVVSGRLTQSGKPILSNDVHLSLTAPALWYLVEMQGPHLHVYGATIPGMPGVVIGHNDHIAWGFTNGFNDVQDLFIIPEGTPLKTIDETISVRGGNPVHFKVYISPHGPIISNVTPDVHKTGLCLALQWTALQPDDTTPGAFFRLQYAQNWTQFVDAMQYFTTTTQNVFYADTAGNIGYYYPGKQPIRCGYNGALPVPAGSKYDWCGFVPFDQLPHVYNPPEGMLFNANNKPVADTYPYLLNFHWVVPPYRVERIKHLLTQETPLTVDTMMAIQYDAVSEYWRDLRPILLKTKPLKPIDSKALAILKKWDGDMTLDSQAAIIFAYWVQQFNTLWPKSIAFGSDKWLNPIFVKNTLAQPQYQAYLSTSLAAAVAQLIDRFGETPGGWHWGKVHRAVFDYSGLGNSKAIGWIWRRSIATRGGDYTVNAGTYDVQSFTQMAGASYRQIVDLGNLNQSYFMQTLGQSGHVMSPHYDDLMAKWRNGKYLQMKMQTQACRVGKKGCLVLLP